MIMSALILYGSRRYTPEKIGSKMPVGEMLSVSGHDKELFRKIWGIQYELNIKL
jgi:hypothetical protein